MSTDGDSIEMIEMPGIDPEKCDGCGLCVDVCRCQAVVMVGNRATIIETKLCGWCALCEMVCPTGAIRCAYEIAVEERSENGR